MEAHALAALVLLHDSRRATRVDADGALVPLEEQDRSRWDRGRIARGLDRLRLAHGSTGPYLPQAVIAAVHATAPSWEQTDWHTICTAYDRLAAMTDSPVVRANRALAVGFRDGPDAGLAALEQVADDPTAGAIQPRRLGARRPTAPGRTARRCPHLVSRGVGVQRFRPGPRLSAPSDHRVRRINSITLRRSYG